MNPSSAVDLFLLLLAVLVIPGLSYSTGRAYGRSGVERSLVGRYWFIIGRGIVISLLIVGAWRWDNRPYAALGLDFPIGFRGCLGFVFDAVLCCCYAYALLLRRLSAERMAVARQRLGAYRILPQTETEFALFPLVGIVGSIFEELLYRGFLIWFFAPFAGIWGAAILSAGFFGLGHTYQGLFGVMRTGVIGFAFAIGYVLTHSLWWLILAHIMISIFGGLYARRLRDGSARDISVPLAPR